MGLLSAGPVRAAGLEATLSGYMQQWFGVNDQDEDTTDGPAGAGAKFTETHFTSDTEVHFKAKATLDNGLRLDYHVELEGNTSGDQIDESYLTISGSFGQVIFGSENSAGYKMQAVPKEFGIKANTGDTTEWINGGGQGNGGAGRFRTGFMSGYVEVDSSCNDDKRLTYFTPRISGFQFGASYTANCGSQDTNVLGTDAAIEHVVSLGANYKQKFERVSVGLSAGYHRGDKPSGNAGDDPQVYTLGATLGFAGFTLGGYWSQTIDSIHSTPTSGLNAGVVSDKENEGFGVGLAYEQGPWGVSVMYLHGEREGTIASSDRDELDTVHLAAMYKLGPGIAAHATLGWAEFEAESGAAGEFDNEGWFVVGGFKVSF